jgi:hypothetical protein
MLKPVTLAAATQPNPPGWSVSPAYLFHQIRSQDSVSSSQPFWTANGAATTMGD